MLSRVQYYIVSCARLQARVAIFRVEHHLQLIAKFAGRFNSRSILLWFWCFRAGRAWLRSLSCRTGSLENCHLSFETRRCGKGGALISTKIGYNSREFQERIIYQVLPNSN